MSGVSTLVAYVAAWPPPGPTPAAFQFHHQGSNFAVFVIMFALCMMEVVVLKIMTEDQRERAGASASSMWYDMDDD